MIAYPVLGQILENIPHAAIDEPVALDEVAVGLLQGQVPRSARELRPKVYR